MSDMSATPPVPTGRRSFPRRLIVAAVALLPACVFLACSVLQFGLGVAGAVTWMDPAFNTSGVKVITIAAVLLGPAAAAVLALSWLLPLRWTRDDDAWEVRIRVRLDPNAIAILAISLACGAILYGHIAAENAACVIGLTAGC